MMISKVSMVSGIALLVHLAGAGACSEREAPAGSSETPATSKAPVSPAPSQPGSEQAGQVAPKAGQPAGVPAGVGDSQAAGSTAGPAGTAAPARPAGAGQDFIDEARMLYRVVACSGSAPIPDALDAKVVAAHCKRLLPRLDEYRARYATRAKEFIAALRPPGLPTTVVYPFGGGDLISALVAFPDATDITTMSLEHAGDPRRIRDLESQELEQSLADISLEIGGMLSVSNNTSKNMSEAHQNLLPAQLSSFLIGLAAHGYEPTSVRYLALQDDGSIRYLSREDIALLDGERARQLKHDWAQPNFSPAFSHVELRFRRVGAGPGEPEPERIHRHFAVNLSDAHLDKQPAILGHLAGKGKVAAMTKAASYLLWRGDFSRIRDYLLANMVWMISDSTGIPPFHASRAGMKQTTLGNFEASFLDALERHNEDFRALWQSQPRRRLPFRFGYVDSLKQAHLLITAPETPAAQPAVQPAAQPAAQPLRPATTSK